MKLEIKIANLLLKNNNKMINLEKCQKYQITSFDRRKIEIHKVIIAVRNMNCI